MATVYLSADIGNNANTYVQAQDPATPWLTVAKLQSSAVDGDTAILLDSVATYAMATITFTKQFTLQGESLGGAIIDGAGAKVGWHFNLNAGIWNFSNIILQNFTAGGLSPHRGGFSAVYPSSAYNYWTDCIFRNIGVYNIDASYGGLFAGNSIQMCVTLTRCALSRLFVDPVYAVGADQYIFNLSNIAPLSLYETSIHIPSGATPFSKLMARMNYNSNLINMRNVIIQTATSMAFKDNTPHANSVFQYSCFNNFTSAETGTGVITSDPLFVDPTNDNLNLRPTSPCIDTGVLL